MVSTLKVLVTSTVKILVKKLIEAIVNMYMKTGKIWNGSSCPAFAHKRTHYRGYPKSGTSKKALFLDILSNLAMKGPQMWPKSIMTCKYYQKCPLEKKIRVFRAPGAEIWLFKKKNMDRSIDLAVQHKYFGNHYTTTLFSQWFPSFVFPTTSSSLFHSSLLSAS